MKGWIALDIDGTITRDKYSVPSEVIDYLHSLEKLGWRIALATGRSFKYGSLALTKFDFPYYFLPQNGSIVLKMPERKIIDKEYIDANDLPNADCLIYSGFERGDFCFYRPDHFTAEEKKYIAAVMEREKEAWRGVEQLDLQEIGSTPMIKYFGPHNEMTPLAAKLSAQFEVTQIKDPHVENVDLLLVTKKGVSKGESLIRLIQKEGRGERIIVAGDDRNDLSLFEVADVKIAMAHGPKELLEKADVIAEEIVAALKGVL